MRGFLRQSSTHPSYLAMNERIFTSFVHSSPLSSNEREDLYVIRPLIQLSGNEREDFYVNRPLIPAFWQRTRRFLRHSFTLPRFLATNEKILTSFVHSSPLSGNEREDSYVIRSLITPIWQRTRGFLRQSSTHQHDLARNERIFTSFVHSSRLSGNERVDFYLIHPLISMIWQGTRGFLRHHRFLATYIPYIFPSE